MVSTDFFTEPTVRFQVLYVFLALAHDRRRILHFNVTAHPTAEWTAQQLREAFPWDTAPRSPWQPAYVERVIGTIRRGCLDHVIVFNEADLLAGQGHAGTAARAPAGTRTGRCHAASWRSSPPLRAARSLNFVRLHPGPSRGRVRLDLRLFEDRAAVRSPAVDPGRKRRSKTRPPQSRSRLAACLRAAISLRRRKS